MRHPATITAAGLLASVALALAGCSAIPDPLNEPLPVHADRTPNEVGAPRTGRPSRTALEAAASTPTEAIKQFGTLYINWTAHTLADHQRRLAAISTGEASSTETRAVAHTRADYELRRSRIANQGRIVAIAPTLPHRTGTYMVVTRERTTGIGLYNRLGPAYHLTIATVARIAGGWAVSQWHPQT